MEEFQSIWDNLPLHGECLSYTEGAIVKIYCSSCNSEIQAVDINVTDKLAKCNNCNNVFNIAQRVLDSSLAKERDFVNMPKNFRIERRPGELIIIRKWFTPAIIVLTFFCLFWNGFMALWFYISFKQKIYIMALFGLIHGVVGLGMLYSVIAGYLNKTYIRIMYDSINIVSVPLPWFGKRKILRNELKQLYSKESINHSKNGNSCSYAVHAITNSGRNIELISGLFLSQEALFIEQEVEKYLKIGDEAVIGEISR